MPFKKINTLYRFIIIICAVYLLLSSCTYKDNKPDKSLIKGTWKGIAFCKELIEYKVYAPLLQDSLTKLRDSMIVLPDIVMDVAKDELRFYGLKELSSVVYQHQWEQDRLVLQRNLPVEKSIQSTSFPLELYTNPPAVNIIKLDADSLVMQLAVYAEDSWKQHLLKLKRQ